ncbi:hypothetical protein B0T25DRAFT_1146 [Lasiosphaeria hispida]|uniref:Uncharacterized protein n=1 Tax=Lasiosphaeria hispida TaxID=260671 RepID=A0AAJ0HT33_9PEZI|nr:hypothetical protein B0T25DRAFT_1146 [Lasiosphaeria hispida]
MANFPKLIPAFTANIVIDPPTPIGPTARGGNLVHVAFIPNMGFIRSELGYPIELDAVFVHGVDNIKADPDGKSARLDVQSAAKDKATGALVRFSYTGTVTMGGAAGKVLTGASDAATTGFGEIFTHVVFEAGLPGLAALQDKVYVGSGRFILEPGKPVTVEYKISEIAD